MKTLQEIFAPKENVNDEIMLVAKLYLRTGDAVKPGDALLDLETSKVVLNIEAGERGFVEYLCREDDEVKIGALICRIMDEAVNPEHAPPPPEGPRAETAFSKAALALMQKENIGKEHFSGRDFVGEEDVRKAIQCRAGDGMAEGTPPSGTTAEKLTMKKLSMSKRAEIRNLSVVQSAGLNSAASVFVDLDNVFEAVNASLQLFKDSLLPLVVFEVSRLLKVFPEFNAFFMNNNIAFYKDAHIGLAMDLGAGLKVVKIPNADGKDIFEIESELTQLAEKYEQNKLTEEELTGSTFTITDLSFEGVGFFHPLINREQSAVLGISAVDEKLNRCALTLTFDHRVTEGRKAGRFLRELKARIESYGNEALGGTRPATHSDAKCHVCLASLEQDRRNDGPGLLRVIGHDGEEKFICHLCMLGY